MREGPRAVPRRGDGGIPLKSGLAANYVDLRVFKRNEANLRQPIANDRTCTRRYGTYSGASQYGL
jgi:hypothetical protein